ncbi:MAG: class I SAM-dependent methyltransferase, partial [Prevotellaceae bacterium]|nr:class I SAM-dependent methyltransferase [Prevotellaceae bacterium]
TPERFPFRTLYNLYSRLIPFAGKVFAKNEAAYSYLPDSISAVPQNDEMTAIMTKNGFDCAEYKTFTFGVCTMYSGKHP